MKKALFISLGISSKNPGISGGEMRFVEVARAWKNLGIEINLLSTNGGPLVFEKLKLDANFHFIEEGADFLKQALENDGGRLTFFVKSLAGMFLPSSLGGFNEGIVYSSNEQLYDILPGLMLKLRNLFSVKWVVVVHWLPPWEFWTRKRTVLLNSFLFLISERMSLYLACMFADKILAVSKSTKRQIQNDIIGKFFLSKVADVECGVNYDEIVSIPKAEKKYDAVFMKRLQAVKGVFDLIEIWEKVVKVKSDAKLAIIGSGIDGDQIKKIVEEKNLQSNIIFLGAIFDFQEKYRVLSSAEMFILPTYEENWAIVIGEAMARGLPVISYDLKELQEVWQDNFIGVPVGDTEKFAEKALYLLNNAPVREELSKKGLEFVKRYRWENIGKKELELSTN